MGGVLSRLVALVGVVLLAAAPVQGMTAEATAPASAAHSLKLHPAYGPTGTLVHFKGHVVGVEREEVETPPIDEFLTRYVTLTLHGRKYQCALTDGLHDAHAVFHPKTGVVVGKFLVTKDGGCEGNSRLARTIGPGKYRFALGCPVCFVATFRVTHR